MGYAEDKLRWEAEAAAEKDRQGIIMAEGASSKPLGIFPRGKGVQADMIGATSGATEIPEHLLSDATPIPKMISLVPGVTRGEGIGGEQYQGIYSPKTAAPVATPAVAPVAGPIVAPMEKTEKPHPMAQYKDQYDFAEKATPAQLKKFIDVNDPNDPRLKGLGYIETTDPKTGKLRIEKVVSRPEAGGGIGRIPDMNAAQLAATAHLLGIGESNDLRRQHLDQLRVANELAIGEKKESKAAALDEKKVVDFHKKLLDLSPPGPIGEDGKAQKLHVVGLLDLMDKGESIQNMHGYTDIAKSVWDQREQEIAAAFAQGKKQYIPGDINKPGTETYNLRKIAIKKLRDKMVGKE